MPALELSPSVEKALAVFENGARKSVDCDALLGNSFHAFSLLERWETAVSNVPSVMAIIDQVKEQGHVYYETLHDSISIAESLYELAKDAKQLASTLLEPGHTPEEIQEFVAEMRTYTRSSLEKSKGTSARLRDVRKAINKITDSIPGEMAKLERREHRMMEKNEALERRIQHARVAKTVSTAALAVVGGVSALVFPPVLLILPVGLPIAILVMQAYEQHSSKTLMKRDDEIWECRAGLQELKDVTSCLSGVAQHIDVLAEFWLRSDTMLDTISKGVHRIRGNTARIRLESIKSLWEEVAEAYLKYAVKLKMIQECDCVAASSLRSITSSSSKRDSSPGSDKDSDRRDRKKGAPQDLQRRNAIPPARHSSEQPSSRSKRSSH